MQPETIITVEPMDQTLEEENRRLKQEIEELKKRDMHTQNLLYFHQSQTNALHHEIHFLRNENSFLHNREMARNKKEEDSSLKNRSAFHAINFCPWKGYENNGTNKRQRGAGF